MPTKRFFRFLLLAIVLYLFANQTQVGWLYIIFSLLIGIMLMSYWLNRKAIHSLQVTREIDWRDEYVEGESLVVVLTFVTSHRLSGYQLRIDELCPVADLNGEQFLQQWFIPSLNQPVGMPHAASAGEAQHTVPLENKIEYEVELYKRGVYTFPAVEISSRFPFGLFERNNYKENLVPDDCLSLLVYPEVRPLSHLNLLDRRPAAEMVMPRAGSGNEFLSLRPYRYGDSPRHIHWRSVARTGRLVSKEFADESLPGMALIIGRYVVEVEKDDDAQENIGRSKYTPFETAVKIAASVGDYALQRGHALTLIDQNDEAPRGAVTADMLLQYLARIDESTAEQAFSDALDRVQQTCVAAVLPFTDPAAIDSLIALKQRGHEVLVIFLDSESFPEQDVSGRGVPCYAQGPAHWTPKLVELGVECYTIKFGDDWTEIISGRDQHD